MPEKNLWKQIIQVEINCNENEASSSASKVIMMNMILLKMENILICVRKMNYIISKSMEKNEIKLF